MPGLEALDLMDGSPLDALIASWIDEGKPDVSLAQFLQLHQIEWSPEARRLVDHSLSGSYAANLDQLGVYGLMEATYAGDGDRYFRLRQGYSHLLEQFAAGLDIRYATPRHSHQLECVRRPGANRHGPDLHRPTGRDHLAPGAIAGQHGGV